MIIDPTVLILGAGASVPFGFPSGRELLIEICKRLGSRGATFFVTMEQCGYDLTAQEVFKNELYGSFQPSVDAFLEKRPEFMEIGKAAISCALIPYENQTALITRPEKAEWYEYLFGKMDTGWDRFAENRLSIITLNYDRSLEHFLFTALIHSYDKSEEDTASLLRTIPIVHVYGQLGQLPYLAGGGRPYTSDVHPDIVAQCVSEIKIVHENVHDATFSAAHELLAGAQKICFLGFGYHSDNLQRLRLDKLPKDTRILGSVLGLGGAEIQGVQRFFIETCGRSAQLGGENLDVLRMLRDFPVLQ